MALGSLEPCTCTMECGCEQHQGEGLGDVDDNGTVPNCPIADVKDDKDEVRTFLDRHYLWRSHDPISGIWSIFF